MTLFKSHGIHEPVPPERPRSYRWPRFGPAVPRPSGGDFAAGVDACVRALTRVQPVQWEDLLASYDRAA